MSQRRTPWNKGLQQGQMKPFTLEEVGAIKSHLRSEGRLRDLCLFAIGFDSLLRGADLVQLKVCDVTDTMGNVRETFAIRQKKTGNGTVMVLTDETRKITAEWISASGKVSDDYLFTGLHKNKMGHIGTDNYRVLVKRWAGMIGLNPQFYSSHSIRRTKASLAYKKSGHDIRIVQFMLGHKNISSTAEYLGVTQEEALEFAKKIKF